MLKIQLNNLGVREPLAARFSTVARKIRIPDPAGTRILVGFGLLGQRHIPWSHTYPETVPRASSGVHEHGLRTHTKSNCILRIMLHGLYAALPIMGLKAGQEACGVSNRWRGGRSLAFLNRFEALMI